MPEWGEVTEIIPELLGRLILLGLLTPRGRVRLEN
jgi:hypothetical protein